MVKFQGSALLHKSHFLGEALRSKIDYLTTFNTLFSSGLILGGMIHLNSTVSNFSWLQHYVDILHKHD